jgi:hypothetical protein
MFLILLIVFIVDQIVRCLPSVCTAPSKVLFVTQNLLSQVILSWTSIEAHIEDVEG